MRVSFRWVRSHPTITHLIIPAKSKLRAAVRKLPRHPIWSRFQVFMTTYNGPISGQIASTLSPSPALLLPLAAAALPTRVRSLRRRSHQVQPPSVPPMPPLQRLRQGTAPALWPPHPLHRQANVAESAMLRTSVPCSVMPLSSPSATTKRLCRLFEPSHVCRILKASV